MPLVIPLLKGPLTEWSDSLLVEGALPGATVLARTLGPNPRDIAKDVVSGGRDRVPLLPGIKLQEKDRILVQQGLGAEKSGWTPDPLAVPVGKAPTDHGLLAPLSFKSRAWQCGARVWVKGAVPGAQVVVTVAGGVIASGRATEAGDARLALTASLPGVGQSLQAHQEAPPGFPPLAGTPVATSTVVLRIPVGLKEKLPAPFLGGSRPMGCDGSFLLAGVFDGADVTVLRRSDGSSETATFDLDRLSFVLSKPLSSGGDKLEISQALTRCREWLPSDPLRVDVPPAAKPGTPSLLPPCADSVDVYVNQLEPGAVVTLAYQGKDYRGMVPPSATSFVFRLTPLAANETLTARQERCGLSSDPGSVTVPGVGLSIGQVPDVVDPLVACARAVRVTALTGAWVQVWASSAGGATPISNQVFATADSLRVEVTPYLHESQEVWLTYRLCGGGAWEESPHHRVEPKPDVGPTNIVLPLVEGTKSVTVDAIPGAAVDVFAITGMPLNVEHIGSGFVDPRVKWVGLTRPLTQRDLVFAEQRLCSDKSGVGATRNVLPAVRQFTLGMPLKRLSTRNMPKPLVCQSATVILRHNGSWAATAFLENEEEEADCSFDLQFKLEGVSSPFGLVLSGDLSGKGSTQGTALLGIPSSQTFSRQDRFAGFSSPTYWEEVLGATFRFELFVAWNDYEGYPEDGEYEETPDPPP
ncbi:hypothetical protein D7X74_24180 [Corallococcus sp. CA047B]|uniref:hypothetical protein n=1 Tax=Corallococcus sp. CA047B TaxID=2316729 RepID=UPI000EA2E8D3|nr:hypothetical protein [Corallococcus sp. CA047B]RKH12110.1 hypothetical protein D7X74_24180 [Corallococcus sp. CA047B]